MACGDLVSQIKNLLDQYENGGGSVECPPTTEPCVTCCMVCPPPIMAPTVPQPVKPLQLPCPVSAQDGPHISEEEAERTRYANFYNNYNIDWHAESRNASRACPDPRTERCTGVTTDGKNPCCPDKKKPVEEDKGCPTGFKPCTMKLSPPNDCHPCGVWCAEVQPCPPKPKKKVSRYQPGPCKRPCCKHWKPKDGECQYDDPCKAHCFNHPIGIKPKKRF
ncbi:uncharacterized protein LOC115887446 isoform X1 [Sitophilus oryzae]|uniref:Uncharacterized protein LOC115887446 isoform X1 n=1 Tax=Sitophilus oryzae TaxID=7048 RepID=A0A6J2YH33_SITOR|nr:uncharacterized protein LOC115887446 isoform X1 [Sitophilus oryzae]